MSHGGLRLRAARRPAPIVLAALLGIGAAQAPADEIARGDSAWAQRAEGARDGRPRSGPIRRAVDAYERALAAQPRNLEARWKLLRALHFAGDFAAPDRAEALRSFERARDVSERGLELLAARVGSPEPLDSIDPASLRDRLAGSELAPSDVARLYFWSAINWGAWSRRVGLIGAVRQGVANRLQRYTSVAIALEPEYEEGGALRLLGRLHAELPRLPFVTGWVDRDRAIPLVERAYAIAPENPGNRLLLGLTLLDLAPERRAEALGLLERVERLTPRPGMRIEDLAMRREARERLAAARAKRA